MLERRETIFLALIFMKAVGETPGLAPNIAAEVSDSGIFVRNVRACFLSWREKRKQYSQLMQPTYMWGQQPQIVDETQQK